MVNKVDRAKQFLPFDALKGYKEAIMQKQKIIVNKKHLSEDDEKVLSYKLNQLKVGMMVKIIYYDVDAYTLFEGLVSKINLEERYIKIVKNKISIDDIVSISSQQIKEYEIE